ncbi:hypothetical protein FHR24_000204 [Wenyingzhuangia heitensis]|uniref:Uncharacterized protein n=1 Tax=Wenyingzhuangia heitensis TaxID=1487859 RepID=A0ABX0U7N7_9FLAO|nr:hypothetical protein [Wenyingzhuangia heitensis]NIJ43765.1 hypothetical protein [Wenyingzhuangia heitensis]
MKNFLFKISLSILVFLSGYSNSYASLVGNDFDFEKLENLQEGSGDNISYQKEASFIHQMHIHNHHEDYVLEIDEEEESESHHKILPALSNFTSVYRQEPNLGFFTLKSSVYKSFSYVSLKRHILFCVIRI